MKLTKSPIEAPYAALLIAALSIGPAAANVDNGRAATDTQVISVAKNDSTYVNPRKAPERSEPIIGSGKLKSNARGKTNGRQG